MLFFSVQLKQNYIVLNFPMSLRSSLKVCGGGDWWMGVGWWVQVCKPPLVFIFCPLVNLNNNVDIVFMSGKEVNFYNLKQNRCFLNFLDLNLECYIQYTILKFCLFNCLHGFNLSLRRILTLLNILIKSPAYVKHDQHMRDVATHQDSFMSWLGIRGDISKTLN